MEARSLAQLADVASGDRSAQKRTLLTRANAIAGRIQRYLWDPTRGIYANRFRLNNSLSAAIGPTSFYPMQAGIASVRQAEEMVTRWMSNRSRFCVSADFPFADPDGGGNGNTSCYSGCRASAPTTFRTATARAGTAATGGVMSGARWTC